MDLGTMAQKAQAGEYTGVQQLRQRGHEALLARVVQGPSQRDGNMGIEEDFRFHLDVGHVDVVLLPRVECSQWVKGRWRKLVEKIGERVRFTFIHNFREGSQKAANP